MQYEESYNVEFKQEVNADFKKEIVAFANSDGGELYIGVDRYGNAVGVANADETMEQVGNMIRDGIKPDLTAYTAIEAVRENGKTLVRVSVLRGVKRPYHLAEKGLKPSGVFVRHGVSSVPATDEMIREMLRESDGATFDASRCINQDLTFSYAETCFAKAGLPFGESQKRTLGLVDSDGYYTNTALLLSDECEHSIKCAVYEGTGKTKFKTRKEFCGSVLRQIDEAYEFLSLCNNLNSTFEGLHRIDHPDYPAYAIREALLNSVVHRDYDYSGSIIINIYDDRMEFISLGGLVKGITMQDILGGVSQSRNTRLANVFYRLELIESYGTGIKRILESYEGSETKPTFTPAPASFVTVLPKIKERKKGTSEQSGQETEKEKKVLSYLSERGESCRKDVEKMLGIGKLPTIQTLNALIDCNKITKTGKGPSVKYKLA